MLFNVGDRVVLCAPSPNNSSGWGQSMYYFIGDWGVVKEIYSEDNLAYMVEFPAQRFNDDGTQLTNHWYCNEAWLVPYDETPVDTEELDNFFSNFGGDDSAEH